MKRDCYMKLPLNKLVKSSMLALIVSSGLMIGNVNHANGDTILTGNTQVGLKKDTNLYDSHKLKKIKSKSAKNYFGNSYLYEKKSTNVKKSTYKLVQSENGKKSG
ncbi:MAG: hypothetical protein M3Z82_10235, partial [Apilactobacillus sp.]|nr:hypothetical protein [Apilactobacillus sp.]